MKTFISIIVLLLLSQANAPAQSIKIGDSISNRPLQWSDFAGTPDAASPYFANTAWNINYSYNAVHFNEVKAIINDLEVTLQFNRDKSWKKKDNISDALLKHEQGHFDIATLCQLEIINLIKNAALHKNDYSSQIKNIFRQSIQKYKALEDRYDIETEHSLNTTKQEEWNKFIQSEKKQLTK